MYIFERNMALQIFQTDPSSFGFVYSGIVINCREYFQLPLWQPRIVPNTKLLG